MRTLSIKQKLMLITLASTLMALLLVAVAFLTHEFISFRKDMVKNLTALAKITGNQSTVSISFGDRETAATEVLRPLSTLEPLMAACLYRKLEKTNSYEIFVPYYFASRTNTIIPPHPGPEGARFANGRLILFHYIQLNGENIGALYLESSLDELHQRLWHYALILGLFTSMALAAAYLLAMRLQRIISRPISQLASTARMVSTQKNYSVRAPRESSDELGLLIDGFNEMLEQIQRRDETLNHVNEELEARVEERTRDLQQQFARISLLNQITYAVAARQDFDSIILVVLGQLEDHLPVDYGSAYLYDEKMETLRVIARGPKSRPVAERLRIPMEMPIASTPFRPCVKGQMVYIPDSNREESLLAKKKAEAGYFSTVAVPLIVDQKVFGILVLIRREKNGFNAAERNFIHGLSAHVALAIHQASLYQDLRKAYNELRQTQQAVMQQERLKALGQMASGIAHDINNALSPIVGFAELIQKNEKHLGTNTKRHLHYIKTAGEDIAHIVARLREFYRPRGQESLALLNLNDAVEQVIGMTRPRWRDIPQNSGVMIEMRTDLDSALPELPCIESEMREVLVNLILNAVDALPNGGAITIRTRPVDIATPAGAVRNVVLEVSDTGIGMDEQTRKRCLEPFFSTKGTRGTGLGLSMVYGVVERHEGKIEIDSELNKGTTMRLVFPVRKWDTPDGGGAVSEGKIIPLHILCIDDEPLLRELLKEMLCREGHTVEMTDGGKTGLAAFEAARNNGTPFDVVITDLGMPYMDGREVASAIKGQSPETPVVMLTGWGAFMNRDSGTPTQIDGILSKPPRIRELRTMLSRVAKRTGNKK